MFFILGSDKLDTNIAILLRTQMEDDFDIDLARFFFLFVLILRVKSNILA